MSPPPRPSRNDIVSVLSNVSADDKIRPATDFARPAFAWHNTRRAALLKNPSVKELIKNGAGNLREELLITFSVKLLVVAVHFGVALGLCRLATYASRGLLCISVVAAAATVGGQCAYLVQALNHELSHAVLAIGPRGVRWGETLWASGLALCAAGASLTHVPWTAYYFGGGHTRHHRLAGSRMDVDADALFYLWNPPYHGMIARFFWISVGATLVPVAYAASLGYYFVRDPRYNIYELSLAMFQVSLAVPAWYTVGMSGIVYFVLSSWFSMGFMCHPLAGFWILQHLCVGGVQPTVSYRGSTIWNWLCLNELLHVEHHDFAKLSWRYLPKLREAAPEMYNGLYDELSLMGLLYTWLQGADIGAKNSELKGPTYNLDFGCRRIWHSSRTGKVLYNQPVNVQRQIDRRPLSNKEVQKQEADLDSDEGEEEEYCEGEVETSGDDDECIMAQTSGCRPRIRVLPPQSDSIENQSAHGVRQAKLRELESRVSALWNMVELADSGKLRMPSTCRGLAIKVATETNSWLKAQPPTEDLVHKIAHVDQIAAEIVKKINS